jgi:hypothetical protein
LFKIEPMTGIFSDTMSSERFNLGERLHVCTKATTALIMTARTAHHQACKALEIPITNSVKAGRSAPKSSNNSWNCGTTKKNYAPSFKTKIAVAAIKGEATIAELASRYQVHPNLITKWKHHALESLPDVFANGQRGFLYLVASMDWHLRRVLSLRLSNTLDADFCVAALKEALARFGPPELFNTD